MIIVVNGSRVDIEAGTTVAELVESYAPGGGRGVAIAMDREVVARSAWPTTTLVPGSAIEILGAVAGG